MSRARTARLHRKTADIVNGRCSTAPCWSGRSRRGSFAAVNAAQPAPIDYFIGPDDNLTVAAFIQNADGRHRRLGRPQARRHLRGRIFSAPTGNVRWRVSPAATCWAATSSASRCRIAYRPPRYRWRVPYARNWTVQTDLAGGVTRPARRSWPSRTAGGGDLATIQTDHPFARTATRCRRISATRPTPHAEAARLIDLFKTTRAIYRMTLPRRGAAPRHRRRDHRDHPRFDLSQGRAMIVVETSVNVVRRRRPIDSVEIAAYG
jgi:hypothetical protein